MTPIATDRENGREVEHGRSGSTRRTFLRHLGASSGALALGLSGPTAVAAVRAEDTDRESAAISFRNQSTDGVAIAIDSVTLPDGGYVSIRDARFVADDGDDTEDTDGTDITGIVGMSDFLEAGTHTDLEFPLFVIRGIDFEVGHLQRDQWLVAVPHRETTGDETFDYVMTAGDEDDPYTEDGAPVADAGFATLEDATDGLYYAT